MINERSLRSAKNRCIACSMPLTAVLDDLSPRRSATGGVSPPPPTMEKETRRRRSPNDADLPGSRGCLCPESIPGGLLATFRSNAAPLDNGDLLTHCFVRANSDCSRRIATGLVRMPWWNGPSMRFWNLEEPMPRTILPAFAQ